MLKVFDKYRSLISFWLALIIFLIVSSSNVKAFSDDFTTDPRNNPNWLVQNSAGLAFDNPGITLTSTDSSFPYLKSSPVNDLSINKYYEIKFQYLTSYSDWGVGASFTDNAPNFPTYLGPIEDYLKYNITYFFGNHLHAVTTLCPLESAICPNNWWFIYPNTPSANSYLPTTPRDFNIHTFSAIRTDVSLNLYSYKVSMDGKLIVETKPSSRLINSMWIGHPSNLDSPKSWPILRILSVKSLLNSPSAFPYLSQKDLSWGSNEYDSATGWAGMDKAGIDRWGCAITSVAMILQKYGVKTPDGTYGGSDVNPDILNTWLKSQPDGYVGPGLLNWIAVTRYAKASFDAGYSDNKLEFVRSYSPATPTLPAILGIPGHFVVAHDEDLTNWKINDPASDTKTTLLKTSTIVSVNRYIPSHTNLTNMLFVVNPDVTMSLQNSLNESVPIDWIDEYLTDDVDGESMPTIRSGIVAKPTNGKYRLAVNQPSGGTNVLRIFLYDETASTSAQTFSLTDPVNNFDIEYASESARVRTIIPIDLTPPPVPTLLSPETGAHVKPAGLSLDWSDVTDLSLPVTYNYKSSWPGGSYGPVSTGINSYIDAPGTPDQIYHWQIQACDSAGNCSAWSAPSDLTVDSGAPTVDLVFPTPGASSNYFEAVFSEPINPAEVTNGANYYLSNWPGAGGSGDLQGDADITYNVESKTAMILFTNLGWYISPEQLWRVQNIHDLAGNLIYVNPYSEYSTKMIAPLISSPISTPNPSDALTQNWAWIAGSDTGSGIKGYSTRTYDLRAQQYLTDWLWLGNVLTTTTNLGEGEWQLSLKGTDYAGNNSLVVNSLSLLLDMTSPTTIINTWGSEISGTAMDALSGIEQVQIVYRKDDGDENIVTALGTTQWKYIFPDPIVGKYSVSAYAYDRAGNKSVGINKDFDINVAEPNRVTETVNVLGEQTNFVPILATHKPIAKKLSLTASVLGDETTITQSSNDPIQTTEENLNVPKPAKTYFSWWWGLPIALTSLVTYLLVRKK